MTKTSLPPVCDSSPALVWKKAWRFFLVAAWSCSLAVIVSAAPPDDMQPGFPDVQLPAKKMRGEAALSALGDKLPALAAHYRTTAQELRARMRKDDSLWVDSRGRLFYACDFGIPEATNSPPPGFSLLAAFPYEDTFRLHSRPGATKVVYLDFDGHDASATSWPDDAVGRPFDLDGDPTSFNTTERDRIQYIWQRVAEDFALYDLDVTTEDPGVEALRNTGGGDANYGMRVIIGGSSSDWYGSAGGVASVGSFNGSTDRGCWVWPGSLGNSEKNIAEAASHEVGHTLGLSHDGRTSPVETYFYGHGNWAPIMGVGYNRPIVQWSKGEYANASQTQDDLTVMLNEGIAYRPDDHANTIVGATLKTGVAFTASGNIERTTDVDFFSFQTGAGRVTISATPSPRSPNLHILLSLHDAGGALITSTNSPDTSGGTQPTTLSAVLPIGSYYFSVDGIGEGNPATDGYSDYASLGEYTITATLPSDATWIPTAADTAYSWTNTANWAANAIPLGADAIARINNNIAGDQTLNLDMPVTLGRLYLGDANASHGFTIQNGLAGALVFQATAGNAGIAKTTGYDDVITADILMQSDFSVTNSTANELTLAGPISGSRNLTKMGAGRLTLTATNVYSGATTIGGGTLALAPGASIANSPIINVRAGAVLDATASGGFVLNSNQTFGGSGSVAGDFFAQNQSRIAPGTNGGRGTLTFSNSLVLESGSTLLFDLANSPAPGDGTNDLLVVNGDLNLIGSVAVNFNFLTGLPASPATYTLIRYSGALSGGAANLTAMNATNRYVFAFDDSVPGEIRVHVSGEPAALIWQGDGLLNRWDAQTALNWTDEGSPAQFNQLDRVTFDDAGSTTPAVNLIGALNPAVVTVSSANPYTFSGGGKIGGLASLYKQGAGLLTINTANDYTGITVISNGTLRAGHPTALGLTNSNTTIAAGGALDVFAMDLGAEPVTVQGAGPSGGGAIINGSATAQSNALRFVALSGHTTIGGTGRWDIRANPTGSLLGNNFNLNKTGANDIWLADLGGTGLGEITNNQGQLVISDSTTLGDATKNLHLAPGAGLVLWQTDNNVLNKRLAMNGSRLQSLKGDNIFSGPITLNGSNVITSSDIFSLQGVISGTGSLAKTGIGILSMSGANNYTGETLIAEGTLVTRNSGALGNASAGTTVAANARLDVNGFNLGAEPITVSGDGLGNAGAVINNGGSQQNALRFVTLTGNTTFGGINRWDIRANPSGALNATNVTLTKTGRNEIWLANLGTNGLGAVVINEGLLGVTGTTTLGNPTSVLSINGANLGLSALSSNPLGKVTTMSSGRIFNSAGNNALAGGITLSSSNAFDVSSATTLTLDGIISGSGSLHKFGTGLLILVSNNTYTGVTAIQAGTLQVGNAGPGGTLGTGTVTNNSTLAFNRTNALTVSAAIHGSGALNQNGTGVLTLSGNNSYIGPTTLNAGVLAIGTDTAIGSGTLIFNAAGAGSVGLRSSTATARTLTNYLLFSSGSAIFGSGGTGDLIFNGPAVNCGGATRTLNISNAVTTFTCPITNANSSLIKDGPGTLVFAGNNTYSGSTIVSAGTVRIDAENRLGNSPVAPFKPAHLTLTGGTLNTTATFALDDANRGVTIAGSGGTFNVNAGTVLTLATTIGGVGTLTKTGAGTLTLSANNNYSGGTFITASTLALSGSGQIANSPLIRVDGGTVFDVSGVSGTYTLANPQTLAGNGTINGNVIANGTVSPGASVGKLVFNNALTLNGVTAMETSKAGVVRTNDVITTGSTLTFGGTLTVAHSGNTLTNGDSFKLFNAPVFAGSFAVKNLPPLNPGLRWDTAQLTTSGTIQVVLLAQPQILPVSFDGTNLLISVLSEAGASYVLEASETAQAPINWTSIATNIGTGGILTFPVPVGVAPTQSFFRFKVY